VTPSIQDLERALQTLRNAGPNASFKKVAEQYDELILELHQIPDDVWNVVKVMFSDRDILARRGLEHFLLEMNVDLPKYSSTQLREFLSVLIANVDAIDSELARHAVGDFIARAYPPNIALKAFQTLAIGHPRAMHAAFVGLDILRLRSEGPLADVISRLHQDLLRRHSEWRSAS
jgi:hypothetical protein